MVTLFIPLCRPSQSASVSALPDFLCQQKAEARRVSVISLSQDNTLHLKILCCPLSRKILVPSTTSSVRYIFAVVISSTFPKIFSIFSVCPKMSCSSVLKFWFCFALMAVSRIPLAPMVMVLPEGFR